METPSAYQDPKSPKVRCSWTLNEAIVEAFHRELFGRAPRMMVETALWVLSHLDPESIDECRALMCDGKEPPEQMPIFLRRIGRTQAEAKPASRIAEFFHDDDEPGAYSG